MDAQWEALVVLPSEIISDDETWTTPLVRNCNNPLTTTDFRLSGQSNTTSEGERDSNLHGKCEEDEMARSLMTDQRPAGYTGEDINLSGYVPCIGRAMTTGYSFHSVVATSP